MDVDGVRHWFSISGNPLFRADGAFRGYRGSGKDVTAQKRVETPGHGAHGNEHPGGSGLLSRVWRSGEPVWIIDLIAGESPALPFHCAWN